MSSSNWGTPFTTDNGEHDDEHSEDDGIDAASSSASAGTTQVLVRTDATASRPQNTLKYRRTPSGRAYK